MTLTPSQMLSLGTKAPAFSLPDVVGGQTITLDTFAQKKALLVMFICRHCPYVKHVQDQITALGRDYQNKNLGIVAISTNDPSTYPEDAPESLGQQAKEQNFTFPYCFDETQETAKAYSAACTPDFFLFDNERKLVYRGQLDDARPGNNKPVTGQDLRAAIDAALAGESINPDQKPSTGCNIKWKVDNAPNYFK